MIERLMTLFVALSVLYACPSQAHHSFATYDIDNKIKRTGVLTRFSFSSPHIQLVLEIERKDGSKETWGIQGTVY